MRGRDRAVGAGRGWSRGGAAALVAAVLAVLLAAAALTAPPARAAGQLDEAAAALADGPGVWVADGYEGASDEAVALMNARYARAETPIRVALVTEDIGRDDSAAERLASAVGEPGVYIVRSEVDTPLSDLPETWEAAAVTAAGVSMDDLLDEELARAGIGTGDFLLSLPDALDGDLRPWVASTTGEEPVFVDPAVEEAFPHIGASVITGAFVGAPEIRVAVVSGLGGDDEAARSSMLDDLPPDGAAVLLRWDGTYFAPSVVAGSALPFDNADLEGVVGGTGGTDVPAGEVVERLELLAATVGRDPLDLARGTLADGGVFVHPGISDGRTTYEELIDYQERLAEWHPWLRVAFLPEEVLELRMGDEMPATGPGLAELLSIDGTDTAVYLVSPYDGGRITDLSLTGSTGFVEEARWTQDGDPFIKGTLDELLTVVAAEDSPDGPGGVAFDVDWAGLLPYLLAVACVLVFWFALAVAARASRPKRRRRAVERSRSRLAALTAAEAAREREQARAAALAWREELVSLGDDLADLPEPAGGSRLEYVQRMRAEYERLLAAEEDTLTRDEVGLVRTDARRLRRRLDSWRGSAGGDDRHAPADSR
ncbi:hypothetical protein [Streptomyces sp. RFCAC02]|uniref:hypothetical protein n=1 Tax=Streptomyces sp. RFCAC02 TaxID=2499143 RepID=UPI001020DEF3|nr:hypothetical protein [Streptomyces sp. RFCAC02]